MKNMKKCFLIATVVLLLFASGGIEGAFAQETGEDSSRTNVTVGQENDIQVIVGGSGGDGDDKYQGIGVGVPETGFPGIPNIPVTKGDHYQFNKSKTIFGLLPSPLTRGWIATYIKRKPSLVEDGRKRKFAKKFKEARKKLREEASVAVGVEAAPTSAVSVYFKHPDPNVVVEGEDYRRMGFLTFSTLEELERWYRRIKLKNITSYDLGLLVAEASMDLGADMFVIVGEGAEALFKTEAAGGSLSGFFARALSVTGVHALPSAGSLASTAGRTRGQNHIEAKPFLTVFLYQVMNPNKVFASYERKPKPVAAKPAAAVAGAQDPSLGLVMCTKPVAEPNGRLRLQRAHQFLMKYLASHQTDLGALISFQDDLRQAIRDNIKGERLKVARVGMARAYYERAKVLEREDIKKSYPNAEELLGPHIENLEKAKSFNVGFPLSLEVYASQLAAVLPPLKK